MATEEIKQDPEIQPLLKLTQKAIQQVKTILEREHLTGYGLRVSVVSGGCSGFSYRLDFEKEEKPGDNVLEMDGLKVHVDPSSAQYLNQTVIDYVSALHGAGFKFTNPNSTAACGCGNSFSA
ncbi:MAG: HesB/IscA family protein [Candidatus Binatia bacterium]